MNHLKGESIVGEACCPVGWIDDWNNGMKPWQLAKRTCRNQNCLKLIGHAPPGKLAFDNGTSPTFFNRRYTSSFMLGFSSQSSCSFRGFLILQKVEGKNPVTQLFSFPKAFGGAAFQRLSQQGCPNWAVTCDDKFTSSSSTAKLFKTRSWCGWFRILWFTGSQKSICLSEIRIPRNPSTRITSNVAVCWSLHKHIPRAVPGNDHGNQVFSTLQVIRLCCANVPSASLAGFYSESLTKSWIVIRGCAEFSLHIWIPIRTWIMDGCTVYWDFELFYCLEITWRTD